MAERLVVEVVYIAPGVEHILAVELAAGSSVEDAIVRSGILQAVPTLTMETLHLGIYGRSVTLATRLEAEDRVEIYRPLVLGPMAARRQRAQANRRPQTAQRSTLGHGAGVD